MTAPARIVVIGTPCLTGQADAWYVNALVETVRRGVTRGVGIYPILTCYDSIVQNVRNDLVRDARNNPHVTDLIFIDDDQAWDPDWVFQLLAYPVDCVGGTVRKKTDQAELYNVRTALGPTAIKPSAIPGLWEGPDLCLGTGFLRLSRRALDILWDNSEPYLAYGQEEARWIFDIRPVKGELMGEDIAVSMKLRKHGIDTYLDPTMTCDHIGPKKFSGNFMNWLTRAQAAEAEAAKATPQIAAVEPFDFDLTG